MATILAADLGGTKTLVRLAQVASNGAVQRIILEQRYSSAEFSSLSAILEQFLSTASDHDHPGAACIAVAGPVTEARSEQTAVVTNLPWRLASEELQQNLRISRVKLTNDFVAVGHGVAGKLRDDDVLVFSGGTAAVSDGPRVVLGAGTGLGVCQIFYPPGGNPLVCPSEGGHMDFAAQDETQYRFHRYMAEKHGHVSYDRIVCGAGIGDSFAFFAAQAGQSTNPEVRKILAADDVAAAVSSSAADNPLCAAAMDLFFAVYGAVAGNLALLAMPYGGVFLAGGIAPKLANGLRNSRFTKAYLDKGRLSHVVNKIPVRLITDTNIGLSGAAALAARLLRDE